MTQLENQASRLRHGVGVFAMALWAGLVTGFLEALILWFKQAILGQVIFASRHILWMTPLAYMLIFGALGVVIAIVAVAVPRSVTLPVALFFFTAFGIGCLLLPVHQLHRYAMALLAIGAGVQASRLGSRYLRQFPAFAIRSAGILSLMAVAAGAGAWIVGRVQLEPAGLGNSLTRSQLPNVLIIVWDTVRAANLSLHGYAQPTTPGLEQLGSKGVVFQRAFSTSPWTLPSHATMFTGRLPHELSADWFTRLDGTYPTLAEIFRARGYATGGFVANHHYTSYDSGLDRGFEEYRDYRISLTQLRESTSLTQTPSMRRLLTSRSLGEAWEALRMSNWAVPVKRGSDRKHADAVNTEFLEWVDGIGDRPFFSFLNYFDAHAEYWSPPSFQRRFLAETQQMNRYDAAIAYLDSQVTQLLGALAERGMLDNTLVVITSDHGELFGENALFGHAHNLYLPVLHVPLVILLPGAVPAGLSVKEEVSLLDLPSTILDLAAIQDGTGIPGKSLARYWRPGSRSTVAGPLVAEVSAGRNVSPTYPTSRGPMKALISNGFQYILNGDGSEELYSYEQDVRTERNLIASPDAAPALGQFRKSMQEMFDTAQLHLSTGIAASGRR